MKRGLGSRVNFKARYAKNSQNHKVKGILPYRNMGGELI